MAAVAAVAAAALVAACDEALVLAIEFTCFGDNEVDDVPEEEGECTPHVLVRICATQYTAHTSHTQHTQHTG